MRSSAGARHFHYKFPFSISATAKWFRVFEKLVRHAEARTMSRRYRLSTRVRTASGIRIRGVVRVDEELPGAAVEPTLEEAYLAEATEGQVRLGCFSFLTAES